MSSEEEHQSSESGQDNSEQSPDSPENEHSENDLEAGFIEEETSALPVAEVIEVEGHESSLTVPAPSDGCECIEVVEGEQRHYVLKNSNFPAYLRLDEKEHFLWQRIDGRADLHEIAEEYFSEYKTLGFERIGKLLHKLVDLGLVNMVSGSLWTDRSGEDPDAGEEEALSLLDWLKGLALKPVGPKLGDRTFEILDRFGFSFLGGPQVLRLLAFLGLSGLAVFVHSLMTKGTDQIHQALQPGGFYSLAFAGLYLWMAVGSIVHELIRAAALKANGCEVLEARLAFRFGIIGIYVDIRDYQVLPRSKCRAVLLSGVWAEVFLLGTLGMLSGSVSIAGYQEFLALGALVMGFRLFMHACPFVDSPVYRAVVESYHFPQLRRAALRFLRPDYWRRIWQKEEWEVKETVYFCFGIWSALWAALAVQLASFLLSSQLTKTIIRLLDRAFLGVFQLTADELVALLMVLLVFVPVLIFLALSVFYAFASLTRVVPDLAIWRIPGRSVRALSAFGFMVSLVSWLSAGRTGEFIVRLILVLWGLSIARVLFESLKIEFDTLSFKNAKAHILPLVAATVLLVGVLAEACAVGVWPYVVGAGAVIALMALVSNVPKFLALKSFPLATIWVALSGSLAGTAAFGAASIAANQSILPLPNLWISLSLGCAWFTLAAGAGYWFHLHAVEKTAPHFEYHELSAEHELLAEGCGYVLTALLTNLETCGGQAFSDSLQESLKESAIEKPVNISIEKGDDIRVNCEIENSKDINQTGEVLQALVTATIERGIGVTGQTVMTQLVNSIQTHLPWDDRRVVRQFIFQGTRWDKEFQESRELSRSDRLKLLSDTFLFHQFDEDELAVIASLVGSRTYDRGEDIIVQDEEGNEAYIIQDGRVAIIVEDEFGETHTIAQLTTGDFFGELALLENSHRSATVRAIDRVEVLLLDRSVFESFIEHYGGAREKLSESVRALRVIQQMPLFDEFSTGEVATVATQFRVETFDRNEAIVTQGEIGEKFYVIQTGTADVVIPENGNEKVIQTLKEQDFFGEIALLLDVPRTATVRAAEPLTVFSLDRKDFLELVGGNPFARRKLIATSDRRTRSFAEINRTDDTKGDQQS